MIKLLCLHVQAAFPVPSVKLYAGRTGTASQSTRPQRQLALAGGS